jgi:hypothetical protein
MGIWVRRLSTGVISVLLLFFCVSNVRAQAPADFHWVDLEKDQWMVNTVRKALHDETFTAIRDIGLVGDAALVFTSNRSRPDAIPDTDSMSVYAASLRTPESRKLISGYQVHSVGWTSMVKDHRGELAATYLDCVQCESTMFFTTFYFDGKADTWQVRWAANQHGAPLTSKPANKAYAIQQVYAVLGGADGREALVTWSHYDYNNSKKADDFIYKYDVDPISNLDRVQRLSGKDVSEMELRLCQADQAWPVLRYGQDGPICHALVQAKSSRPRHVTTTPPAQNEGRSRPPQ